MSKELRLMVGIPSTQEWDAEFGMSLVLMSTFMGFPVPGFDRQSVRIHNKRGSILAQMRQELVEQAMEMEATHLLFVDSDQVFPKDLVHRMLRRMLKPEVQVVAANVATKMLPSTPTARGFDKEPVYTLPESQGLEKVWRVGTGVMMIDMRVFERSGMVEPPWFDVKWNAETGKYVGEDWYFCQRLERAGVSLWVDHDLSKEIGHRGVLAYDHSMVEVDGRYPWQEVVEDGAVCSGEEESVLEAG